MVYKNPGKHLHILYIQKFINQARCCLLMVQGSFNWRGLCIKRTHFLHFDFLQSQNELEVNFLGPYIAPKAFRIQPLTTSYNI